MQIKSFLLKGLFLFIFASFIVSCSDSDDLVDVDEFVDETIVTVNRTANAGAHGCFEFVLPLTIELPDGTFITGETFQEIRTQARAWKEANPDVEGKPSLVFPIELITEDGDLISVADRSELREIVKECKRDMNQQGPHRVRCFRLVFPATIVFPDETSAEVNNRKEAKIAIRSWKKDNPDSDERPSLLYPIEVEMEDGTIVTVNSKEELKALKEECAE